jgi:hypothetical protein
MAFTQRIEGDASGNIAEVNTSKELKVALSAEEGTAGFAKFLDGSGEKLRVTDTGALLTSSREVTLFEQVDGSSLNTNRWTTSTSGMTIVQGGGYITLNNGAALTANAYAILQSIKSVPLYGALPVVIAANIKTTVTPQANATMEFGVGSVATNAAPTDGCYFRWNSAGEFRAIINNGGETSSLALTIPAINDAVLLEIEIIEDEVAFFVDDIEVAIVTVPVALSYPTNSGRLPIFMRVYNGASSPAQAPTLSLGQLTVVQQDVVQRRTWDTVLAAMGNAAYQSPTAFTQTGNNTNSTAPATIAAGSLSNTTTAYATLGGKFAFAGVAGAATDFALFAFQVPAGYQLYAKGITISCNVLGAAVVTATLLDWSLGINGSAVDLATANSPPTSWSPRRIALGTQGFLALAGIGQGAADIVCTFQVPLVVDGGRYLHIILGIPSGAQTALLVFRGTVSIDGYFE